MTLPIRLKGKKYTDNDEAARRRAHAISQIGKAYEAGGAYSDIDTSVPAEKAFNAEKDYDILRRVQRYKVSYPKPDKPR